MASTSPDKREIEDGLPPRERRLAMLAIIIAVAVSSLDISVANVALPTIAENLHSSPAASIWVINAYQLAVMLLVLPLASLGDIYGYRRIYCIGLGVFILASLACALSTSLPMLAAARAAQGAGAAGIMCVNSALLRYIYPRAMLGRGIGINALVVSSSSATGPTVAAAILSFASWPWLFAINVPVGIVALLLSLKTLPPNRRSLHRFDFLSALLNGLTFALLITGIDGFGHGERPSIAVTEIVFAVLIGAVFAWRQFSLPFPMLPVDLFRRPIFSLSVVTSISSFIAQGLAIVSMPFYLEGTLGLTQVQTGLMITPWPVAVGIIGPLAGRLSDRYPAGVLGGLGLTGMSIGLLLLAFLPAHPALADIVWRVAICGIGFGLFQAPNNRAILLAAPRERSGGAGAIVSTARLIGQTTGAAIVALIFGLAADAPGAMSNSETKAILIAAGFAAAAAGISCLRLFDFDAAAVD